MKDYKKYINALRKCAKEHENDGTFTGHIIVSDLCRDTANLLEALEQEPFMNKPCVAHQVCHEDKVKVLDKIRAEIEEQKKERCFDDDDMFVYRTGLDDALYIIDKYKAESEVSDADSD